jgi:hypothetical protein
VRAVATTMRGGGSAAMHCPSRLAAAVAVAALSGLGGCCSQKADQTTVRVAQVPASALVATYQTNVYDDARFTTVVEVDTGSRCNVLSTSATADVGGQPLVSHQDSGPACACDGSEFSGEGTVPATPEATIRVADESGEMSATAPRLFVRRYVSVRGAPAELRPGTRVYLDVIPADEPVEELTATFSVYSGAVYRTLFELRSSDGSIAQDGGGWSFIVPDVAPASGTLSARARTQVATSACAGAGRCEIVANAIGWVTTSVVAP